MRELLVRKLLLHEAVLEFNEVESIEVEFVEAGFVEFGELRAAQAPEGLKLGEDFPMLCENCLGEDKFVRMMKMRAHAACKLTNRPFTVFRWRPANTRQFKETQVCYEVAADKNICQCCMNDLDYNVPLALRESLEAAASSSSSGAAAAAAGGGSGGGGGGGGQSYAPVSEVNQAFYFNQQLADANRREGWSQTAPGFKFRHMAKQTFSATGAPIDLPPICNNWARGRCGRSVRLACRSRPCCGAFIFPELHNSPLADRVKQLEIQLREKGPIKIVPTDPEMQSALLGVAQAEINRRHEKALRPPSDTSIKTLFLAGIPAKATTTALRAALDSLGKVRQLKFTPGKPSALVEFANRNDAETAVQHLQGRFYLANSKKAIRVGWAVKRKTSGDAADSSLDAEEETFPERKKRRTDSESSSRLQRANSSDAEQDAAIQAAQEHNRKQKLREADEVAEAEQNKPETEDTETAKAPLPRQQHANETRNMTKQRQDSLQTIEEAGDEEEDEEEDSESSDDDDDDEDEEDVEKSHPRAPAQGIQGLVRAPVPIPELVPGILLPAGMRPGDKLPVLPPGLVAVYQKEIAPDFKPRPISSPTASPVNSGSCAKPEDLYPSLQGYALEGSIALF
ncbi:Pre-mRNA-splicing factor RBM22 [Hondaea fermentalgiana]|uniref:Pre-mRNA-splicing factor RBM22 n=1 Tax=Hondaea fermentalgiana TaxID=2315210 RepID=A0A2R5GIC6_9STRA|nr:Pre-mRNA-splicing factor RBM22 [Hondaea fermentalgiana]|eukprot:GBG30345.1 Pre-mRNA-splicing factor RBM22 [Hondaea fermentalgiana]